MVESLEKALDTDENVPGCEQSPNTLEKKSLGLDLRSLILIVLEGYRLLSVKQLVTLVHHYDKEQCEILNALLQSCEESDGKVCPTKSFEKRCRSSNVLNVEYYLDVYHKVYQDYLEIAPRPHKGKLTEQDLLCTSAREQLCDVCGDVIEYGEEYYQRTLPSVAVRHRRCNNLFRSSCEYAFIDFILNEIEYFQKVFMYCENCDYVLTKSAGISLKQHEKSGFLTDADGVLIKLPDFGSFVIDYISGEENYDLVKKYRPYHVYLEFLVKLFGYTNYDLVKIGAYKYLLREPDTAFPELCKQIENIALSDIISDSKIHSMISRQTVNIVLEEAICILFSKNGLMSGDHMINVGGSTLTYSVNDETSYSDISIIADADLIICVDSEKSLDIAEYFGFSDPESMKIIDYIKQFGVDL